MRNFNYSNMEAELLNTVLEEETIQGISDRPMLYRQMEETEDGMDEEWQEEEEIVKQPGKLAAVLLTSAALFAGLAFFVNQMPTDYEYGNKEATYQNCLEMMADDNYAEAYKSAELLLKEDKNNLEYLALKNTICEQNGDSKEHLKVLRQIIAADPDNYQAYEKLLNIYLEKGSQDKIVKLAQDAPNSAIAAMLKEHLVDAPYLELTPGVYDSSQQLAISSEAGHSIYYTLDGSSPQEKGHLYTMPIPLEQDRFYSVRAICKNDRGAYGDEASGEYQIGINADRTSMYTEISQPSVYPDSGTYNTPQTISFEFPIGYTAYYSWSLGESLTPENGTLYSGGIAMPQGSSVLSVIVTDGQGNCSPVKQVQYTYQP